MFKRYFFLSVLFFFINISSCFCETLTGKELSDSIFNFFSKNNFSNIERINLAKTGQDEFAYNILLTFDNNKNSQENLKNERQIRNNMILVFSQEDVEKRLDDFLDFLLFIKNLENKTYNLQILFSALDEQIIQNDISGTKAFINEIFDTDSAFAIIVKFDEIKEYRLLIGSKIFTTPLWLTKQIANIFIESDIELKNEHKLTSLYRLGMLTGDLQMKYFIDSSIPATTLKVFDDNLNITFKILKSIIEKIDLSESFEWDSHYMFINLTKPFFRFWISENIFVFAFIVITALCLLILCGFSFIGKIGENYKREFIKSWYMIPLIFGLSAGSLILSQMIIKNINFFNDLPFFYCFIGKIIISMAIITVLFFIQDFFKIPINSFVFGYTSSFLAIFNILFFSSIDILFFIIFSIEYFIIHISRPVKKIFFLMLLIVIILIPYIPYIYSIFSLSDENNLKKIIFLDWKGNFIFELAIFPIQIYYQKILVRLQIFSGSHGDSIFKQIINFFLFYITIISIIGIGAYFFEKEIIVEKENKIIPIINNKNEETLSIKISKDEYFKMNTNHIKISSNKKVLKYNVQLVFNNQNPIYDSNYDYKIINENIVSFIIPNYPPNDITIDYVSSVESKTNVKVNTIFVEENNENKMLFTEEYFLEIE